METKFYDESSMMRVFNWHWYKDQMTGWSTRSYQLLFAGILAQLVIGFWSGITPLGLTSTIAGIIGFTCTISITNGKPINGVLGIISAIMLIYVASVTGNYSDIIMQGFYVIFLDIPILKNWTTKKVEPRKLNVKYAIQTALTFVGFFIATYALDISPWLNSPRPFIDALSATIGLTGAVLTVRRFRASYYFWTLQGVASIVLWISTAMAGHAVWVLMFTYCMYLGNNILAFCDKNIAWFHNTKDHENPSESSK